MGSLLDWKPLRSMQLGSTGMQKKPTPTLLRQNDRKRGVVGLAGRSCFDRCAATPRWNIGDSTRGIERCPDRCTGLVGRAPPTGWCNADLSGARPHRKKQKLGNYATTAGHRPGEGRGNDYRPLTVSLGIQGRSHGTTLGSKARGRAPTPNIVRGDLCMVCSTEQGFDAYI